MCRQVQRTKISLSNYCYNTQVDLERFFKTFDMPDTYYSWWLVTELHVWMLCVRLNVGNTKGKLHINILFGIVSK